MARTPSNMILLGSKAPNFNLLDVTSNSTLSLFESKGSIGTVIMFICNHCPYVKHVNPTISKLAKDYNSDEIKFIAISSNDVVNYPDDSPEKTPADEDNFAYQLHDKSEPYNIALLNTYLLSLMQEHLTSKQYDVVRLFYGLDCNKHSAKEIADYIGLKVPTATVIVSQIKKEAIDHLIANVDSNQVIDYL